jgi:hypothetical protein
MYSCHKGPAAGIKPTAGEHVACKANVVSSCWHRHAAHSGNVLQKAKGMKGMLSQHLVRLTAAAAIAMCARTCIHGDLAWVRQAPVTAAWPVPEWMSWPIVSSVNSYACLVSAMPSAPRGSFA